MNNINIRFDSVGRREDEWRACGGRLKCMYIGRYIKRRSTLERFFILSARNNVIGKVMRTSLWVSIFELVRSCR